MKNLWEKISKIAHGIGVIYYLAIFYTTIVSLTVWSYGLYKEKVEPTLANKDAAFYFYCFIILLAIVIVATPFLIVKLLKVDQGNAHPLLNPNLKLIHRKSNFDIHPTGFVKKQKIKLQALDVTDLYEFSTTLTGDGKITVKLTASDPNGCQLLGPSPRALQNVYNVVFPAPLTKDQTVEFELESTVDDPNKTMRPFVSDSFSTCKTHGAYEVTCQFSTTPKEVKREVFSGFTSTSIEPMKIVPLNNGTTRLKVDKVVEGAVYCISWIW